MCSVSECLSVLITQGSKPKDRQIGGKKKKAEGTAAKVYIPSVLMLEAGGLLHVGVQSELPSSRPAN